MTTNTLTDLIPDVYAALDVVSRELTGMIPAVTVDARANRAAVNQSVRVPVVPSSNAMVDTTPAMSIPAEADQTIGNAEIKITKSKAVPFSWQGNEQVGLNSGPGFLSIQQNQIAQAMRTLVNDIELDLASLYVNASRAAGTVTTTPFASTLEGAMNARKILVDNGAPSSDIQLVIDTAAGAKLRTLFGIQTARSNELSQLSDQGVLLNASGVAIRESAQIVSPTVGTGASATTDNAGYAIGATTITLASAGTGTIVAGDVITFAGDANQYVVATGDTNVANGGTIVLAAPGLRKAIAASTTNITVVATGPRNMCFARSAIVLATRMPERPAEGDLALDVMDITDPRTGLTFELAIYGGYRKVRYELALAWGVKNIKAEHSAILLG